MNGSLRIPININGQDLLLTPREVECIKNRTITIEEEISSKIAADVCSVLRYLDKESEEDITLYILSPGGDVYAGLYIYDTIKDLTCDVITVACGNTASMAALLLAAGTKGKRWCQKDANVLIHQPHGGVSGQASDILIQAENISTLRKKLNKIMSDNTGQPLEKIEKDTDRDNIMSAEEALKYGLVDRIGDPISER